MTTVKIDREGLGSLEALRSSRRKILVEDDRTEPASLSRMQRLEAFISRLSTRNRFWQKVCSLIWLPYAFRSGITMKRLDAKRFTAVLPFRRVNRNWYNAMAGAALLGNSEVAGGMYLFSRVGSDFIVVCKEMKYRFLRPCIGPAVYHIIDSEDLDAKLRSGGEFNIRLEMDVRQQVRRRGREPRVGKVEITFHCTPKRMIRERSARREAADLRDVAGERRAAQLAESRGLRAPER
ncbi:MAG: hypothetical protein FJ253_01630 [Phycisphaerae bacterium]|nr:hypothetical protein [Phycisphaerae bacterium]